MGKVTVLCTLPMHPVAEALLRDVADVTVVPDQTSDSLYRALATADFLFVRSQLPLDLFDRPNRLIAVVRSGTGLDMIPMESASARAIPVANVPGANAQAVVEYCLGSFFALTRHLESIDRVLQTNGWNDARRLSLASTELAGKTVGIVGVGTIGASLARACKDGFGMRVMGYRRNIEAMPSFVEAASLDKLFESSDFISINCPLTPETRHLVSDNHLRRMKPEAVLVNAARGAIVDEDALARALGERRIRGAAVDVFLEQPLRNDHPFLDLDNVILTPHIASLTRESIKKMSVGAARQILQILSGERPEHLVNPEIWEQFQVRWSALRSRGKKGAIS